MSFLTVVGLALLPAFGNFAGGLLAEFHRTSPRTLSRALHAAAGIVLAIVAVELAPRAVAGASGWIVGAAFGFGGLAYVAIRRLLENQQSRQGVAAGTRVWFIYLAAVVDLFSDGLMLGAGSAVESRLGLLLAFGQVLADLPEGFAVVASLKANGLSRRWRIVLSAAFVVPVLLAAALSYFLTHAQGPALQMAALMFTAGLLVVAAVEDMISEAHEAAKDRPATVLALVGGFVLFTFVSAGLAE